MRYAVLGTGTVGRTLSGKLRELGHEVTVGSRAGGDGSVGVVKTLNTVNADVMVNPGVVPGSHTVFVCGEDAAARGEDAELLQSFGWPAEDVMDLGGIDAARGTEMYLPLWLRLWGATGTPHLNVNLLSA